MTQAAGGEWHAQWLRLRSLRVERARLALRQAGGIAGQPPQGGRIQAVDQPGQQHATLLGQGAGRQCVGSSGHRGNRRARVGG